MCLSTASRFDDATDDGGGDGSLSYGLVRGKLFKRVEEEEIQIHGVKEREFLEGTGSRMDLAKSVVVGMFNQGWVLVAGGPMIFGREGTRF